MEDTSVFATVMVPIAQALVMASLGLSLTLGDFKRVLVQPRGVLIGLLNLALISPLLAFVVAEMYGLEAGFAVGLVLLGASPGGLMANLLTHLARGDTALSISITAVSSIAALLTVPVFLGLANDYFGAALGEDVSMVSVVARVFAIMIVPLATGMWLRARNPARAIANEGRAMRVALGIFIFVVAATVVSEFDTVIDNVSALAVAAITLNLAAMSLSFAVARLARLDDGQATAITIEVGIHNTGLAIAIGATINDALWIPAAVYSGFMFYTAAAFARLMYRRNTAAERGRPPEAAT